MSQRESVLSRKIMKELRLKNIFCFKVHGSEYMMSGLPDIIACVDGLFVGFEVKHPETRNDTSARQKLVHQQIIDANGTAVVICSVQEALAIVEEILAQE